MCEREGVLGTRGRYWMMRDAGETVGFYSEANREPLKGLKEKREQMDFVFCRDYSGYMDIMEQRWTRTEKDKSDETLCRAQEEHDGDLNKSKETSGESLGVTQMRGLEVQDDIP